MMQEPKLREKIDTAKSRLSEAKTRIEELLREIQVLPRAEKKTISSTVEQAFEQLRMAQAELEELELLLTEPSPEASSTTSDKSSV
jgi:hypothetical protein